MTHDKLQKLLEQREVVTARIRREKGKERTRKRKDDTRRKILAGAGVLERAERDGAFKAELASLLDGFLVRADDRALFGLDPLATDSAAPTSG
jgi:hypothetical protein